MGYGMGYGIGYGMPMGGMYNNYAMEVLVASTLVARSVRLRPHTPTLGLVGLEVSTMACPWVALCTITMVLEVLAAITWASVRPSPKANTTTLGLVELEVTTMVRPWEGQWVWVCP